MRVVDSHVYKGRLEEFTFGPIVMHKCDYLFTPRPFMARWPRHIWTSIFTYGVIFVMFPVLCWLAYAWVQGRLF